PGGRREILARASAHGCHACSCAEVCGGPRRPLERREADRIRSHARTPVRPDGRVHEGTSCTREQEHRTCSGWYTPCAFRARRNPDWFLNLLRTCKGVGMSLH